MNLRYAGLSAQWSPAAVSKCVPPCPAGSRIAVAFKRSQGKVSMFMVDPEHSQAPPETPAPPGPRRRGGRRRGGRGRGRRPTVDAGTAEGAPAEPDDQTHTSAADLPSGAESTPAQAPGEGSQEATAPEANRGAQSPRRDPARNRRPPPPARNLLRETQRQVREIVESLQQALEEMESVHRLLDQVDRERSEDSHDLEALRRSLDTLRSHRSSPRFSGPRSGPSTTGSRSVDEPKDRS